MWGSMFLKHKHSTQMWFILFSVLSWFILRPVFVRFILRLHFWMFYPWREVIYRLIKVHFIQDCYCEGKPPSQPPVTPLWAPEFILLLVWLYSMGCIEGPSARFLSALVENIILYSKRRFPLITLSAAIFFISNASDTEVMGWAKTEERRKWCHLHSHHRSHLKLGWGASHSPYWQLKILPLLCKEWTAIDWADLTHS